MSHLLRPLMAAGLAAVLAAGCAEQAQAPAAAGDGERPTVVVHRTETCACCGDYEEYLAQHGFEVVQELHDDLAEVKSDLGIPDDQASCHTNELDGYVAEGHVPVEALEDLLEQRPDVDGIALAGMPSGSPGMGGPQTEPFEVTTIDDGAVVGELGAY